MPQTETQATIRPQTENLTLSDINLVIQASRPIDSIWIADIGQKESRFYPFKDTIKVDLNRTLSDLYNVYVHSGLNRIGTQLWLDGDKVIIDLMLENDKLEIRKVKSSNLYDASQHFTKKYQSLVQEKSDSVTIDKFLFSEIREYMDTPLSHAMVLNYLDRNQNNRKKVDKVYRLMRMQTDSVKTHLINNTDRITAILDNNAVQFGNYALGDINDQAMTIQLDTSKRYLLDFWFLQCAPCLRDHKRIAQEYSIFADNNIELIGVSRDNNYANWKRYLDKTKYPWLNVREQNPEHRLTYDLSIWDYPAYALIDSQGSIEQRFRSFAQFKQYINNK